MRHRQYTEEEIRQHRRLQQMKRRARKRELITADEIENRQVNCENHELKTRVLMARVAKRKYGGLIPDKVFDELFPQC